MNKRKITALILAAIFFALLLGSCAEGGNDNSGGAKSTAENTKGPSAPGDESSAEALVPHLEGANINVKGFKLKILTSSDERTYAVEQFMGYLDDEGQSDPVSVAVAERNARLEQEFGFSIECESMELGFDTFKTRIRNDAAGDTADYHVIANGSSPMAPLTVEGYCYDLYGLENSYLELDEPWWDPVTQKDMSIGHHLYMVTGDIMLLDDQFTYAMFFNKDLASKYGFDPYKEVYNGTWTMDKMQEMMKEVALPGLDGAMEVESGTTTWGMVGVAFDTYQLIMGGGKAQATKDESDLPRFAMADLPNVDIFLKLIDIVTDRSINAFKESYYSWDSVEGDKVRDHFYNGYSLFMPTTVSAVSGDKMRSAEIHYGILPMPKYNKEQDNYSSTINPYHFFVMGIPTTVDENIDKITFCLEAMAYTSRESVTGAYYELTLKLKRFADDDDSPEMLDIIFRNRLVDISVIFDWGGCIQYYNNMFFGNNRGIVAYCERMQPTFEAAMQQTIDAYSELDGHID